MRTPPNGFFLTLEGPDGCGKTTLVRLLGQWLADRGLTTVVTFEPGATALGQRVRRLLLEDAVDMSPLSEAFLLAADRAQHVHEVIRPALAKGNIVVSDRYVDSSIVYQGYAGGVPVATVRRINEEATGGLYPDLTILLDVPADVARRRRGATRDRFESRGERFQQRLRDGFRRLAAEHPDRIEVVANTDAPERVCERIGRLLLARFERLGLAPLEGEPTGAGKDG